MHLLFIEFYGLAKLHVMYYLLNFVYSCWTHLAVFVQTTKCACHSKVLLSMTSFISLINVRFVYLIFILDKFKCQI